VQSTGRPIRSVVIQTAMGKHAQADTLDSGYAVYHVVYNNPLKVI